MAGVRQIEKSPHISNGHSIITEWRNPPKDSSQTTLYNQLYEERAIDVFPSYFRKTTPSYKKSLPPTYNSSAQTTRTDQCQLSKMGTLRSIPIKNYRASIAQNIGTLRRSLPSQHKFENYKQPGSFKWQNPRPDLRSAFSLGSSEGTLLINEHYLTKRSDRINRECRSPIGTADPDASPDSLECCNLVNHTNNNSHCSSSILYSKTQTANKKWHDVPNFESGHVVQKISAYEENSCCIRQERRNDPSLGMTEIKQHKSIGVPLVGMHNACGLPVIAHWQRSRMSKFSSRGKVFRNHRHLRNMSQKNFKRRAPAELGDSDLKTGWLLIKDRSKPFSRRRKCIKRPSFNFTKIGTFPVKKVLTSGKKDADRESMISKFSVSFERQSGKRTTLYAKDEGEEAVNALKKLCLNPLARNNNADVMIW